MIALGSPAIAILLGACAATQPVRVLPKGETRWTASMGGPLLPHHVPRGFIPYTNIGKMWARSDAVTLSANVHVLAAANPGIRTLVIESGFSNGNAMAESANPLGIPVRWLLREPMENTKKIAAVTAPVLIMHGEADIQIPVAQARELYAAARGTKELRIEEGAGHEDVQKVIGLVAYRAQMRSFTNAGVP